MKNSIFIVLATLLFFSVSCTKREILLSENTQEPYYPIQTKSLIEKDTEFEYFVSEEDIQSYLTYKTLSGKVDYTKSSVEPFKMEGVIPFYVINYDEGGWEIVSADKRIQSSLCVSKEGSFSMKEYEDSPLGTWMATIAEDIIALRDVEVPVTLEDNPDFYFWTAITEPETILKSAVNVKRVRDVDPILEENGHYELTSVKVTESPDTITKKHLTKTLWHQDNNPYVPMTSDYSSRCPSGCVAVAGAQMLYFLHNAWGIPEKAPTSAYCIGNVNNYDMGQGNFNAIAWANMGKYTSDKSNMLVANIGTLVGMEYGDNGSSSSMADLKDKAFSEGYGVLCDMGVYSIDIVNKYLRDKNIPLVARAQTSGSRIGHCFLIDGYKYTEKITTYYYEWVCDGSSTPVVQKDPYSVNSYSKNSCCYIYMNWGQGGISNDVACVPGGDWTYFGSHTSNYNSNRKVLYNFSY